MFPEDCEQQRDLVEFATQADGVNLLSTELPAPSEVRLRPGDDIVMSDTVDFVMPGSNLGGSQMFTAFNDKIKLITAQNPATFASPVFAQKQPQLESH